MFVCRIIRGAVGDGSKNWPPQLQQCLGLYSFILHIPNMGRTDCDDSGSHGRTLCLPACIEASLVSCFLCCKSVVLSHVSLFLFENRGI